MSDLERFTAFLREAAASYHAPPEAPREEMWAAIEDLWPGIERTLMGRGAESGDAADRTAEITAEIETPLPPVGSMAPELSYHAPPEPPREAMWDRIEAAWALRRSVDADAREVGLGELEPVGPAMAPGAEPRAPRRRGRAVWLGGAALAASLILGFVLGRGTSPFGDDGTRVATGSPGTTPAHSTPATGVPGPDVAATPDAGSASGDLPAADRPVGSIEPLEGARLASAPDRGPGGSPAATPPTEVAVDASATAAERRALAARYATTAHLGRAETLLTAFRADRADGGQTGELAGWARELLGETRLLLDLPVSRAPRERALLEELELVLAQIARLGPEAPAFERDLVAEGLERQGTLPRLRASGPGASVGT